METIDAVRRSGESADDRVRSRAAADDTPAPALQCPPAGESFRSALWAQQSRPGERAAHGKSFFIKSSPILACRVLTSTAGSFDIARRFEHVGRTLLQQLRKSLAPSPTREKIQAEISHRKQPLWDHAVRLESGSARMPHATQPRRTTARIARRTAQ